MILNGGKFGRSDFWLSLEWGKNWGLFPKGGKSEFCPVEGWNKRYMAWQLRAWSLELVYKLCDLRRITLNSLCLSFLLVNGVNNNKYHRIVMLIHELIRVNHLEEWFTLMWHWVSVQWVEPLLHGRAWSLSSGEAKRHYL